MNSTVTLLIEGFLLLGATALIAVVLAIKSTAEGCEDEGGFHLESTRERKE